MTRLRAAHFVICSVLVSGCGRFSQTRSGTPTVEPQWQDALDGPPDLLVAIRPRAARRDSVVGPLLERLIDTGRQRSRIIASTRMLEVMEDADEVIVSLHGSEDRTGLSLGPGDLLVVRGVRADVDPARLVDGDGNMLWSEGPNGPVRELVRDHASDVAMPQDASLFELPSRTWVIATGAARVHARQAFARPTSKQDPGGWTDGLASAHLDGHALARRLPDLHRYTEFGPILRNLTSVDFLLPSGSERSIRVTLKYASPGAASQAESTVRSVLLAVGHANSLPPMWRYALTMARVTWEGKSTIVTDVPWPTKSASESSPALDHGAESTPNDAAGGLMETRPSL